jgi:hypothetical protein
MATPDHTADAARNSTTSSDGNGFSRRTWLTYVFPIHLALARSSMVLWLDVHPLAAASTRSTSGGKCLPAADTHSRMVAIKLSVSCQLARPKMLYA